MSTVSRLTFFSNQLNRIHHSGIDVKDKSANDIQEELEAKATKIRKEMPEKIDKSSLMKIKADVKVTPEIIAHRVA